MIDFTLIAKAHARKGHAYAKEKKYSEAIEANECAQMESHNPVCNVMWWWWWWCHCRCQ